MDLSMDFNPDDFNPDDFNPDDFNPDDFNPDDFNPDASKRRGVGVMPPAPSGRDLSKFLYCRSELKQFVRRDSDTEAEK